METFGQYLRKLRGDRTMREVAKQAKSYPPEERFSAPYLSELERDQMPPPSPNKLRGLARVYAVDYEDMMRRAGHLPPLPDKAAMRQELESAFIRLASQLNRELSEVEKEDIIEYMLFVRQRKREREKRQLQRPNDANSNQDLSPI